jgi:hypothetical protein
MQCSNLRRHSVRGGIHILMLVLALQTGAHAAESNTNQVSPSPAVGSAGAATMPFLGVQKPAWLTDLSLGVKESYDNDVLLVSGEGMKEQDSWITTVSPKLGFNFAPLLEGQSVLQALAIGYAPDFSSFHNVTNESFIAHRFATTIKGKQDGFSFNLENAFNYIDGNKVAPTYTPPDNARSGIATATVRDRRRQFNDRAKIALEYEQDKWFVRPTASLLYYEMMTDLRPNSATTGYQNYPDRYDVNGGLDTGYSIYQGFAATLGYRYGHQYQQQLPKAIDPSLQSSSSDYHRVLAGVEGKPWKWLTMSLQLGPDFRTYEPDVPGVHVTPIADKHPVKYYGEAALTADISAKDQATFKYKQWEWMSSTGKLPYVDTVYDLNYRHKFSQQLALDLGFRILAWDFTGGTGAASKRDDWQYTPSIGLAYSVTANLGFNVAYAVDLGRNVQDDLALVGVSARYREYDHHVVSLGGTFKF